jgi:hypothetical protein
MNTRVIPDQDLWREVLEILQKYLNPSKAARVIASLRIGSGNYLDLKKTLFEGETVKSLARKIAKEQAGPRKTGNRQ